MTPNPSSGSPFRRALFAIAARLLPPVRHLQATNASLGAQVTRAQQERDETARRARMYEALFEQTQDAVAVFDLDGICILANQRCSELLGYTQSELIGVRYGSVSEDTAAARELFARLVAGETIPRYQRTLRHKDGHLLYTETSSTLVRDAEGNPTCVQAVIRDISEQRRAQIELANHSQLLQTLIDNLPDFVYVKDRECRFVITNIAHAKSMGRRPEDIIGKSDMELFPPELASRYIADERRIIATGEPLINQEEPSLGANGQPIWALTSKVALRDSNGEIVGLVGVTRDITQRMARERQIEENERFVNKVTATIPDVLYVFDFEAQLYRYYNDEAIKRVLGYSETEFRRSDQSFMLSIMHPDDVHLFVNWGDRFRALQDDEVLETHYRLRHKDGTWRRFYSRDRVFARNADGVPYQTLGIAQDVTHTVLTDQQLSRQNEYLRALSEITPAIINRFDPNDILATVVARTRTLMQTEYVYLEMIGPPSSDVPDMLNIQRFGGGNYFLKPGEGVVGRVYETGETVVVEDYRHWPYRVDLSKLSHVRASIGIPLKSGERIIGVLGVSYHDDVERAFEAAEIEILTRITELASIALDNAELFASAQRELTERHRVETALRASEERYRTVIESQTELVARFLPDLTLSFVNNAYCRFFRLAPGALVGRSVERLVAEEDRPRLREHLASLTRENPAQTAEFRFRRPDGVLRWLQCSNRAVFGANGRIHEYQMVGRDVTERRLAEEALRVSEARYRAVVESQTELICRFSADNIVTFVNDAYCRYFDLPAEEILGKPLAQRIPAEDWAVMEPRLLAQLRGEIEVAHYEHRVYTPTGEIRWQHWTDRVFFDAEGNVMELQAVGRDITEQKLAQMALNAERDFVSAILESAVALLTVADRDGRIVTFNRACEALSGYRFEEVEGQYVWDKLIPPDELPRVQQVFARVTAGEYPNANVNHWLTRDGQRRLIEWSNTALTDEDGRVTHIVSSGVDVSARKQLEERSLELALEREKVKILGNFIRDASHDFRTPLSILNTNLYLLRRLENAPEFEPRLTEMEQQVAHLTRLIEQLLTMTRLDSGADVRMSHLTLNELVENVSASLYNSVSEKQLDLTLRLADDLPPIKADAWQLNQALRNILANAVQYTPEGGRITIETSGEDDGVRVRVSDTGVGIEPEDLPHIFERFYRADKARSTGEAGTGLGLAIARKIVDLHNGSIEVESTSGEGTTFTVTLPTELIALPSLNSDTIES